VAFLTQLTFKFWSPAHHTGRFNSGTKRLNQNKQNLVERINECIKLFISQVPSSHNSVIQLSVPFKKQPSTPAVKPSKQQEMTS
jgi:hypothetical protein